MEMERISCNREYSKDREKLVEKIEEQKNEIVKAFLRLSPQKVTTAEIKLFALQSRAKELF